MTLEPARAANRGRIPWGMLGMLAFVAVVELLMVCHDLDITEVQSLDWKLSNRRARRDAPRSEILCFGDSLMKLGVAPRIVEARTGRRCYNLGIMSGVAPTDYFLLRRALQSGARPSALVVEFHPGFLEVNYQSFVHRHLLPELLSLGDCWELARALRDADLFAEMLVNWFLPTLRERAEIRHNLMAALEGKGASCREANLYARRNWTINRGSQIMYRKPGHPEGEVEQDQYRCLFNPWRPHRVNLAYVRRFLRMAEQNGLPVYWLIPPFCPELHARREQAGVEAAYTRFARAMQAQFPTVTVVDARAAGFPRSVFVDPVHLDRQGTSILSADLADVLRDRLGAGHQGPRWINLPAYRERAIEGPLEDIHESHMAMKSTDGKLRR